MSPDPKRKTSPPAPSLKDWIAIGGLAFGVVQLIITLYLNQKNAALERALDEASAYRILPPDFLYFNSQAFGNLVKQLESTRQESPNVPALLRVSIVKIAADEPDAQTGRPAGWEAFKAVYSRSLRDPERLRDQRYKFLRLKNGGKEFIDAVFIRFAEGDSAVIQGMDSGSVVLLPIQVAGRHANLSRIKKRTPAQGWFVYQLLGHKRTSEFSIHTPRDQETAGFPGVWQALPEFQR